MQEKLKIFSADGETLLERDLADVAKPLMLLAGDAPQLVEAVPQGADVLGALVRDEDGWTLASAKDDMPVSSGPKTGTDFHLTAGVACALGPWVFRIEREGASTGSVLLWRVGSSAIAADPLIQGRNAVASAKDGAYAVNPAVAGAELCSIFPTADGVDVTAADGAQRLSVPFATLFAVGPFQGMALPASDAAAAVKSGSPFGWPARSTRAGLMAMLLLVGLAALVALSFVKKKQSVDAVLAAKHGPELVSRTLCADDAKNTDEDALVYQNSFFRALPLILKASRSPITRDLLQRGRQIVGHVGGGWSEQQVAVNRGRNEHALTHRIRALENGSRHRIAYRFIKDEILAASPDDTNAVVADQTRDIVGMNPGGVDHCLCAKRFAGRGGDRKSAVFINKLRDFIISTELNAVRYGVFRSGDRKLIRTDDTGAFRVERAEGLVRHVRLQSEQRLF